ncbi:TIGR02452 family protein [Elizabethkingia miricola]|uniref:TIGR02452 family protein n=1 Tax=Elizabethkingia miricola TaxID=172045 RepID=UPI000999FD05|nr:TIGR02452 family protein [Elizabethkingia miricola]OPC40412.1 TIGR02452 family protein [Elizabethkingia miricola]
MKNTNKEIAQETLDILASKYYINNDGENVDIEKELDFCKDNTRFFTTDELSSLIKNETQEIDCNTQIEVWKCSSLEAILQLSNTENQDLIMCLNFASAKNPGGGFINGAVAQEESLARASGLYASQLEAETFYKIHRSMKSCFYTDNMIYSPKVPVFRDDTGELLSKPVFCNFITSAAVNAGVVKHAEQATVTEIITIMDERIDKMLALALEEKNEVLVLGAWGCGVFKNSPEDIAELFKNHLYGKYKGKFRRIVFAIFTKNEEMLKPFESI